MAETNLSAVDWNNLSIEEFHNLEKKLQEIKSNAKSTNQIKRCSGYTVVKIRGDIYKIKTVTYQRLKSMKSEKSREKLIDEIISANNPIEKL
jgi:hypothetical protein